MRDPGGAVPTPASGFPRLVVASRCTRCVGLEESARILDCLQDGFDCRPARRIAETSAGKELRARAAGEQERVVAKFQNELVFGCITHRDGHQDRTSRSRRTTFPAKGSAPYAYGHRELTRSRRAALGSLAPQAYPHQAQQASAEQRERTGLWHRVGVQWLGKQRISIEIERQIVSKQRKGL